MSNKVGNFLRAEVAHLGWADHFRAVIGAGDATADKPDPAPIHLALQQLGYRADAPSGTWGIPRSTCRPPGPPESPQC